jgi:hypothetical protein
MKWIVLAAGRHVAWGRPAGRWCVAGSAFLAHIWARRAPSRSGRAAPRALATPLEEEEVLRRGWVVTALSAGLLQRGDGDFAGQFGPDRASTGLVCLCCHVWSSTAKAVEVVPSRMAAVLLPLTLMSPFLSSRPRNGVHSETVRMQPRPWWRVPVAGRLGGALRIVRVVLVRVGRNPCWFIRHRHGDACGHHLSFLEGVGCTPSLPSSAYRGKP